MRTALIHLGTSCLLFLNLSSYSQICITTPKAITYDTTVIGSGNALHTFTFPKFDPSLGTLMNVRFDTEISLLYSFELENRESVPINNYRVRVTRDDDISSLALMNPLTNTYVRTYGPYPLTAWDGLVGAGTDYISRGPLFVMNHSMVSHTVTNTADFLGIGDVDFDYASNTYSSVLGSVNYTFNATAQDTIRFRITYNYCSTWFLNADIGSFNATKNSESNITLTWNTQNDVQHRKYEIEKSYDGRNFESIATRFSTPDANGKGIYNYSYIIQSTDTKAKIIFRIKQVEKDGVIKYSAIRIVDIKDRDHQPLQLYPNPTHSSSQLFFNNHKRSNWKVEIINMNGFSMKQYIFNNAVTGRLDGLEQLRSGIYILKATDTNSQQVLKSRLVIQD